MIKFSLAAGKCCIDMQARIAYSCTIDERIFLH